MPHYTPPPELLEALPRLEYLVVQDLFPGPLTAHAHAVLPGSSFAEKDGVFVNSARRVQLLRRALDPLAYGYDDLSLMQRMLMAAGAPAAKVISAREVFGQMAQNVPALAGLTHAALGELGVTLSPVGKGAM